MDSKDVLELAWWQWSILVVGGTFALYRLIKYFDRLEERLQQIESDLFEIACGETPDRVREKIEKLNADLERRRPEIERRNAERRREDLLRLKRNAERNVERP